jgi:hypothetical protein
VSAYLDNEGRCDPGAVADVCLRQRGVLLQHEGLPEQPALAVFRNMLDAALSAVGGGDVPHVLRNVADQGQADSPSFARDIGIAYPRVLAAVVDSTPAAANPPMPLTGRRGAEFIGGGTIAGFAGETSICAGGGLYSL